MTALINDDTKYLIQQYTIMPNNDIVKNLALKDIYFKTQHNKFYLLERKSMNVGVNKYVLPDNADDFYEILYYSEKFEISYELMVSILKNFNPDKLKEQPEEILKYLANTYEIPDIIQERAFRNSNIVELNIPKTVKSVGYRAFEYCKDLKSVIINSNSTTFEDECFDCCEIVKLTVPDDFDYTKIIYTCLMDNLPDVIIKDNVLFHVPNCFNFTIPDNVKVIEENCFKNCFDLFEIFIPKTVETINMHAFNGCYDLTVYIETNLFDWAIENDVKTIIHM